MLWFERQVVGTLMSPTLDEPARAAVESLRRHDAARDARAPARRRRGRVVRVRRGAAASSTRSDGSTSGGCGRHIARFENSKIDVIRQYVRLLHSLVLFAENELVPDARAMSDARHRRPDHRIGRGRRGDRGHARTRRSRRHGRRGRPVGRPRRDRAVLARGDGREVPPRRFVRRARPARDRVRRRVAASAGAPRSTAASTTGCRPSSPRSGSASTRSTSSDRRRSTATPPRIEDELGVSRLPGAPPTSSAVLERGAAKLGWQSVEFSRVFRYEPSGRAVKQTMARTLLPARDRSGRERRRRLPGRAASCGAAGASSATECERRRPDGTTRTLHDRRRPRVRLRGREPDPRAAAAQRHPAEHRPRA